MIHKLLFVGLLFVACVGLPMSIYFFHTQKDQKSYVYAETTLPADANNDSVLNVLDYNMLLAYNNQTSMTLFLHKLQDQP